MNPTARVEELRRRATQLRGLATRIEQASVMQLDRAAGHDTWRGTRADLCRATLERNVHQLHLAADDLRWHAHRLAREADALEASLGHAARTGLAG